MTSTAPPRIEAADRAPWFAKVGALVLIGCLLFFGLSKIEDWPFTGWRLYSNMKGPTSGSFFPYRVGRDGKERRINFTLSPGGYKRAPYLLEDIDEFDALDREDLCEAIAEGERLAGHTVREIHIYWQRYRVRIIDHERVKTRIARDLRWTCAKRGGEA